MRVLVLGVTGMLGHDVFKVLDASPVLDVWGALRSSAGLSISVRNSMNACSRVLMCLIRMH